MNDDILSISDSGSHTPENGILSDPWSKRVANHMLVIKEQCLNKASVHMDAGSKANKLETCIRVPSIIVPAISGPLVLLLEQLGSESAIYVSTIGFTLTSICTAVLSYFEFGKKSDERYKAAHKYESLVMEIDTELAKKRQYRMPADVFMTQTKLQFNTLNATSPY